MNCSACGGRVVCIQGGLVCSKCGLVLGEQYDYSYYQPAEVAARNRYRSTERSLDLERKLAAYKETGDGAYHMLKKYSTELCLPNTVFQEALFLYNKLKRCKYPKKIIYAASLYLACATAGVPRPLNKICSVVDEDAMAGDKRLRSNFSKRVSKVIRKLKVRGIVGKKSQEPANYIWHIVNTCALPPEIAEKAFRLLGRWTKDDFPTTHRPEILACALVDLLAREAGLRINVREIANQYNISQVSICKARESLRKFLLEEGKNVASG